MATNQDLNVLVNVRGEEKITGLAARFDALAASAAAASQSVVGTGNALKATDVQLRAAGRRYTEIGRFITRNFSAPLLIAAGASAKLGYDFEKSVSRIASLGGAAAKDLGGLQKQILALSGSTLTAGPRDLAEALYFIRSSGFGAAEGMKVLEAANMGARIGMGDTKTVADAVTSSMNAYGHETLSAIRTTDVFTATVRVGKAEPEALARAIGFVIPIAAQMGVKLQEVGGIIAAMTLQGLSASTSVTGLRAVLTTFTRGLPITQKALAVLGMGLSEVQDSIRTQGLAPTLNAIRKAVDEFDKSGGKFAPRFRKVLAESGESGARAFLKLQRAAGNTAATILSQLFPNVRALNAFLITTGKNAQTTANTIGEVGNSAGETKKRFDEIRKQNWAQFSEVWNKLRTQFTKIGVEILPFFTMLLRGILAVAKALSFDWAGPFKAVGTSLKALIALLGIATIVIGPLLVAYGTLLRVASVFSIKRQQQSAAILAAQARETVAIEQTAVAATSAAETATLAAAATTAGVDATTAAYAREAIAVEALTVMQARQARAATGAALATVVSGAAAIGGGPVVRGAGGRFISPASAAGAEAVEAQRVASLGRVARAYEGVRVAAVGAAASISAAAGVLLPLAAIEGAILLWQNWDKVGTSIYNATMRLDDFAERKHFGFLGDAIGAVNDFLDKQGAVGKIAKYALTGLPGAAFGHGKELEERTKNVKENVKKTDDFAVQLAKSLGISVGAARRLLGLTSGIGSSMKKVNQESKTAFENVFGRLTDDILAVFDATTDKILDKFDATTERMVARLRVTVKVMGRTFTIRAGQKTPAEREAEALEKSVRLLRLRNDLMDAGRAIVAATAMGSPTALREAQQAAAEARAGIRGERLGDRAARERAAADKALTEGERRIRARRAQQRREVVADRALDRRHLQDELKTLQNQLENRRITIAEFNTKLGKLMTNYSVTASNGAKLIGKSFATGMEESLASVAATIKRYAAKLGKDTAKAVKTSLKPVSEALDKAAAVVPVDRGPGHPDPSGRGGLAPPGSVAASQRRYATMQRQREYTKLRRFVSNRIARSQREGVSQEGAINEFVSRHPKFSIARVKSLLENAVPPAQRGRRGGYQYGGTIPGFGPKMIMAHGGETVTPRGKAPKWLIEMRRSMVKLIARQYVRQDRLAARAAAGEHLSARQVYGAQVPRLQKLMVSGQHGRGIAGGEDTFLQKLAMTASSPIQAGLIKTRGGRPDILGPAGRTGNTRPFSGANVSRIPTATQTIVINITESGNARKTAAAVRRELQKTRKRNARKMRGRNAGQVVGAG